MRSFFLLCLILSMPPAVSAAEKKPAALAHLSEQEALRLGEIMYRKGILPSGKKMKAVVQGDIEIDGSMVACATCHLRSGLASSEGSITVPPTDGKHLFRAVRGRSGTGSTRPPYTEETMARALRTGIDPTGQRLDPLMPLYILDDNEVNMLVFYLRNLSATFSPGVTDTTVHFATIVTEGVSDKDREAMLLPLKILLGQKKGPAQFSQPQQQGMTLPGQAYRSPSLDVWELRGKPETWASQMEDYYQKKPVFAMLGGIASGEWAPIHRFCEQKEIPCLLPVTDYPVISDSDWYTLYFSKGLYLEAEIIASYLHGMPDFSRDTPLVQVFRADRESSGLAKYFQELWEKAGGRAPENIPVQEGKTPDRAFWEQLSEKRKQAVFVLWLKANDLSHITALTKGGNRPGKIFISATLLKEKLYSLPDAVRKFTFITYPYRLPEKQQTILPVEGLLKQAKLKTANVAISSRMYFLGWTVLNNIFKNLTYNYYRDYFLDLFDMLSDQTFMTAPYPRLSFGPGQRFASKGCYIVQLSGGKRPQLIGRSAWLTH